jgi:hypothetical protein
MHISTRLFGDGRHGHAERIQTFRGPACHTTFSARRYTPLYRLKTPSHQIAVVLTALAEGLDPSEAPRVFGYRQATITSLSVARWAARSKLARALFLSSPAPVSPVGPLLRTRLRSNTHVLWLWLAIDPCTKILPVLHLGLRTQNAAHAVIHSLRRILSPGCVPLFTSDGLHLYFYALTAHFGQWLELGRRGRKASQWQVAAGLLYGQVKKTYQRRKLVRVTAVVRLGTSAALTVTRPRTGSLWTTQHRFH